MHYLLSQEEKDDLVPKKDLEEKKEHLDFVIDEFKKTWGCIPYHKCHKCPISRHVSGKNVCKNQSYGK